VKLNQLLFSLIRQARDGDSHIWPIMGRKAIKGYKLFEYRILVLLMIPWFLLAVISNLLFGVQSFLYKVGMTKDYDKFELTFSFTLTASVLSFLVYLFRWQSLSLRLIVLLGGVCGLFYFLKTSGQMKALRNVPANIVFPITGSNVALVVLLAVFVLKESLSLTQTVGIALAISVIIAYYARSRGKHIEKGRNYKRGVLIAIGAMIFSAAAAFTNKIAAMLVTKEAFIFLAYAVTAALSLSLFKNKEKEFNPRTLSLGSLIGLINFLGYYSLLTALSVGPLSIISPIVGLNFLATVVLSYVAFREKITPLRVLLILLAVVAAILLRI